MITKAFWSLIVICGAIPACTGEIGPGEEPGMRAETRVVEAADMRPFDVTVHYTGQVLPEDIERLFGGLEVMPVVLDAPEYRDIIAAAVTTPEAPDPAGREISVMLRSREPDVEPWAYFWAWPEGLEPSPRPGVLLVEPEEQMPAARGESPRPAVSVNENWWGIRLDLTHDEMCEVLSATSAAAMTVILSSLGVPPVVTAPVSAYLSTRVDEALDHFVGEQGTTLDVTWVGVVKDIERRGPQTSC